MLSSVIEIVVKRSAPGRDAEEKDRLTMTALYHKIEVFRTPFAEVGCNFDNGRFFYHDLSNYAFRTKWDYQSRDLCLRAPGTNSSCARSVRRNEEEKCIRKSVWD